MLRQLHALLTANRWTRRYQRRLTRRIKRTMGVPDAYGDLLEIIRVHRPAAILDLGSFNGETVARFRDECRIPVHAFEPTPASAAVLRERCKTDPLVTVHQVAIGDRVGTATMFSNANPQTNSLLDNAAGNRESFGEASAHIGAFEVRTTTLDEWLRIHLPEGPLVVKADIQGGEGLLLDGGLEAFSHRILAFYSEAQIESMYQGQADIWTLHRRLRDEFGFALRQIYPCMMNEAGKAVQTDALWVSPSLCRGSQ